MKLGIYEPFTEEAREPLACKETMATAINKRIIGLELEQNITALKAAVDAVSTAVLAWDVRGIDGDLPADAEVKTQLAAYDAISKPVLGITDDLAAIRAIVIP